MTFQDIKELITDQYPSAILGEDLAASPHALLVDKNDLHAICACIHEHQETYFDSLSCVTGIDNGTEKGTMEVAYNLYSIPYNIHLMVKVELDRNEPVIDSVSDIWRTADWQEREIYDLLGIYFNNHPDLRRILLPKDWVGHPLRKDYVEQEKYHGMTVGYDRDEEVDDGQLSEENRK